ncbi:MAG: hypothetical protein KC506_03235, partial [Nanoarchaeota archaeon]|nr:hypothetical protein [Nanoarchaeota archaeon]
YTPWVSSISVDYDVLNTAPTVSLVNPSNGATYGYNESLALNFVVSDVDGNLDSCWYDIDGEQEVMISNCENTSFDVAEGSHTLTIYANDSFGLEVQDSSSFSVAVGSPTISISSPKGSYLNSGSVTFTYTAEDVDLDSCSLWGDFSGSFALNQTDSGVVSGAASTFSLDLEDGDYLWSVACNDSQANFIFGGNQTFHIDRVNPLVSVSQPSGVKNSRLNVPLTFSIVDDSPATCRYNVYKGASVEVANTTVNCSSGSGSFSVTVDADFVLNFYVSDLAGNSNLTNSSFSVDSSAQPVQESSNANKGGGGGRSLPPKVYNETNTLKITFDSNNEVLLKRGSNETFVISVTNSEKIFINDCRFVFNEEPFNSWFEGLTRKGLSSGEKFGFEIFADIPADAEPGAYGAEAVLQCNEGRAVLDLDIGIYRDVFDVGVLDYYRDGNELFFNYALSENAGKDHVVFFKYSLVDVDGVVRYNDEVTWDLAAGEERKGVISFDLPKDSFGEFVLLLELDDGVVGISSENKIFLPSQGFFTGFAISGDNKKTLSYLGVVIFVVLFGFVGYKVFRKFKHKTSKIEISKKKKRKLLELEL